MEHIEIVKKIHQEYGFPIWAIISVLNLNDYDYEISLKRLKEVYCIVGDHPYLDIKKDLCESCYKELEDWFVSGRKRMENG